MERLGALGVLSAFLALFYRSFYPHSLCRSLKTQPPNMSQSATPPQDPNNRQDQIVHRFYLKTVGVLVDGRLTHHGGDSVGASGKGKSREGNGKEVRIDKWVSVVTTTVPCFDVDGPHHNLLLPSHSSISLCPIPTYSDPIYPSINPCRRRFLPDRIPLPQVHYPTW